MSRHRHRLAIGWMVIWSGLVGFTTISTSPAPDALASADSDGLYLVRDPAPEALAGLLADDAFVVWKSRDFLLVVADRGDRARLEYDPDGWELLDGSADDHTYYIVSRPSLDLLDPGEIPARVLWCGDREAVVDADEIEVGLLSGRGFEIAHVAMRPVRPARDGIAIPRAVPATDAIIEEIVAGVSGASIDAYVQRLQDFDTRLATHDSCFAAASYIAGEFASFGFDSVYFHDWTGGRFGPNVVAVQPGAVEPDRIIVIGGHYDFTSPDPDFAPGADDNASGTASMLECARVLSGYRFRSTLIFIAFGAEERGLLGSIAWTDFAFAEGYDIQAMLNVDMIGYVKPSDRMDLDIISEHDFTALRDLVMSVAEVYVPELPVVDGCMHGGTSDHAAFWNQGYHAISFFEDCGFITPWIHTTGDVIGQSYSRPDFAELSTRVGVSLLSTLAAPYELSILHSPLEDTGGVSEPYPVRARITAPEGLNPDSTLVRYWDETRTGIAPLLPTGAGSEYEAFIPPPEPGTWVSYYLVAESGDEARVTHPVGAPGESHAFFVGTEATVFHDDFETGTADWQASAPGDDAIRGLWVRVDPNGTNTSVLLQPEDDHTPEPGTMCWVTGNGPPGGQFGLEDVDGGRTTLVSPVLDLSALTNARVRYHRWFANSGTVLSSDDEWRVDVSSDGGSEWVNLETVAESVREWIEVEVELSERIELTSEVVFRFVAEDLGGEDLVEAALDDFFVLSYVGGATPIDPEPDPAPGATPPATLTQIFPNPYSAHDAIRYRIPSPARPVGLRVYDVGGRLVARLVEARSASGAWIARWDGRDTKGHEVPAGTYFLRLTAGTETISSKLVVVY